MDWNILKGNDNENKDVLMNQIRESRFNGCTGLVTFKEGTNDREADVYDLF